MTKPQKAPIKPKVSKSSSLKNSLIENKSEAKENNVKESFFGKIKRCLVSFRDWLNLNKIFFEAPAALLLSFMAVTLSYWQWQVSKEQTEYLQQQTTIEHEQAMPQFTVVHSQKPNEITHEITKDEILISNTGNIAREIYAMPAVFFKLTSSHEDILVPVHDYYWNNAYTQDATGLAMIFSGEGNVTKRAAIRYEFWKLANKDDFFADMEIDRYVKLSYRDMFDVLHAEYYYVPSVGGAKQLDTTTGEDIFKQYNDRLAQIGYLNFDAITAEYLYSLLNKK